MTNKKRPTAATVRRLYRTAYHRGGNPLQQSDYITFGVGLASHPWRENFYGAQEKEYSGNATAS